MNIRQGKGLGLIAGAALFFAVGCAGAEDEQGTEGAGGAITGTPSDAQNAVERERRQAVLTYLASDYADATPEAFEAVDRSSLPAVVKVSVDLTLARRAALNAKAKVFQWSTAKGEFFVLQAETEGLTIGGKWVGFFDDSGEEYGTCDVATPESQLSNCRVDIE